jgi:ssDNA-binding Zn-finger/Zn-ribbon topoisomerase 1
MTKTTGKSRFLSGETFDQLYARLEAEPVATGDGAPVSKEAIRGDRFLSNKCVKCGLAAALFVFERQYIGLCPNCTTQRIERMAEQGIELPPTVVWLHFETVTETRFQEQKAKDALSVKFDDFSRCHRCGTVMQLKDARYWLPPGRSSSPAYCDRCYEILDSGRDRPREDCPWERKFEFPAG